MWNLYKFIRMLKIPGKKTEVMRQAPASVKPHILIDGEAVKWPSRVAIVGDGKNPKRHHQKAGFIACCCKCCCMLQMCVFFVSNIAYVSALHLSQSASVSNFAFASVSCCQFRSGRFVSANYDGLRQMIYPSVRHDAQHFLEREE